MQGTVNSSNGLWDATADSTVVACLVQSRIAEYIRQKNVEENFESAMEFNPEVFAQVTMLYVNMDVGTPQHPQLQCKNEHSKVPWHCAAHRQVPYPYAVCARVHAVSHAYAPAQACTLC